MRPFYDVIWTRPDQGPLNPYHEDRINVDMQAAISTLSMGPVGIGDSPGYTNVTRVQFIATMGESHDLKHPSRPMTPVDSMYWPGSTKRPTNDGQIWQSSSIIPTPGGKDTSALDPSLPFIKQSYVGPALADSNVSTVASHYL